MLVACSASELRKKDPGERSFKKNIDDILSVTHKAKHIFTLFYFLPVYGSSSQKSTLTHEYL